jgi:hypothetical protein
MTTGAAGAAAAEASAAGEASAVGEGSAVVEALGAAGEGVTGAGGVRALCAPNNVGFHQTTRNATARPTTTALIKKLTRTRVSCN